MKKHIAFLLALLFYASLLPWRAETACVQYYDQCVGDLIVKDGPYIDVRAYGADNTAATDSSAAMALVLGEISNGSTIYFPKGTYMFSQNITIADNDVTMRCDGATLKFGDDFYTTAGTSYGITVTGQRFKMLGCTVDGNKAGQTTSFVGLTLTDVSDAKILFSRFINHIYHSIHANGASTGTRNLLVEGNDFINNYGNANNSDIYSSGDNNTGKIINNHFSRDTSTYGSVAPTNSQSQALYMNGGDWQYIANSFDNIYKPFDFRTGEHIVSGARIRDCGAVLMQGTNDLYVRSWVSDVDATDVQGISAGTTGAYILAGESRIRNLRMVGKTGATDFWFGIRIRGAFATGTSLNFISVTDSYFHGASSSHVYVTGTDNGVLLERNIYKNTTNAANAVWTASNTDNIVSINPILDNIAIPFNDNDFMQRIVGYDSTYRTSAGGKASFDNVTSLVVSHGLSTTPNVISLTADNNALGQLRAASVGATTFTIVSDNAVSGANVYWLAEKRY